jgi:hypothetical protein
MSAQVEIGTNLRVTLVSGVVVEGSVFALDDKTGQLVLTQLPRPGPQQSNNYVNPNVHVINGAFVQSVEMLPDNAHMLLPAGASKRESLPVAENGDVKKLMAKLRAENKRRQGMYHENASIDACDCFEFFQRTNPDVKWSTDPEHLKAASKVAHDAEVKLVLMLSGGAVLLSGNAEADGHSWLHPKVIAFGKDVSPDTVARLERQAQSCRQRAEEIARANFQPPPAPAAAAAVAQQAVAAAAAGQ